VTALTKPIAESLSDRFPASIDEDGVVWVKGKYHHVWYQPRPTYCDRGHWIANIEPAPGAGLNYSIDDSDKWPRYYMDEDRMLMEIRDWLDWRESDGPRRAGEATFGG
jgi:hypothetical protein